MHRPFVCLKQWTSYTWRTVLVACLSGLGCSLHALVLTEIMYHSGRAVDPALDSYEYLELYNETTEPLDLSGAYFDNGIEFTFAPGTILESGRFLILGKHPERPSDLASPVLWFGPFNGSLNNAGERIEMVDANGMELLDLRYGSHGDWPASPGGTGHSLVLEPPGRNHEDPRHWRASRYKGGSLGTLDFPNVADTGDTMVLIDAESDAHYFKGTREPSGGSIDWTATTFNAGAGWLEGTAWLGYSSQANERAFVTTFLEDMRANYASVYTRVAFDLSSDHIMRMENLRLTMNFDDGYVVYLNGERLVALNVNGNPPSHDTEANTASDYQPQFHDLSSSINLLLPGTNILAIQGHNGSINNSSDFILAPYLEASFMEPVIDTNPIDEVVINEFLANSDEGFDWIEFYNPTDLVMDLSGAGLSDDSLDPFQFIFPDGALLDPGAFLVISQTDFAFGLSAAGEAIYLTAKEEDRVIAAYAFGEQEHGISLGRFPDGGNNWYRMPDPSPGTGNTVRRHSPVVLNELMYHSPFGQEGDFLEIRNASDMPVDIGNATFRGIDFQFPAGTVLPPQGILLIADDTRRAAEVYQIPESSFFGQFGGGLSNGGERISLLDCDDVIIDTVRYQDISPWPITPDGLGASLERSCVSPEFDLASDWRSSPPDSPTPGMPNLNNDCTPLPSLPLRMTEIAYHPFTDISDEKDFEFVEILNVSEQSVAMDTWGLTGDIQYQFQSETTLQPGEVIVVAGNPQRLISLYNIAANLVVGPYSGHLPNGGGDVILYAPDGRAADWVEYDDDFPWPSLADGYGTVEGKGHSLERLCLKKSGHDAVHWKVSGTDEPSPGMVPVSDGCEDQPLVPAIQMDPEVVTSDTEPLLTITLAQGSQVTGVHIEYWVDDPEFGNEPVESIPMIRSPILDLEMDATDSWEARMPSFPVHSIVRYRILVDRGAGTEVISPRMDGDVYAWHAWFVQASGGSGHLPTYHLFLSSTDWSQLINWTGPGRVSGSTPNPNWNNEVSAVFVADGVVHDVTVRHQGSRWNRNNGSNINFNCPSHRSDGIAQVRSWRIRFPNYRNHDGMDVMLLQKQAGWPQHVSFEMFKMAGIPAPRTFWADLKINGCDYNNDAFVIERPGNDLIADWFPEVGDLFKSQGYTGDEGPWSWGDARLIVGNRNGFREQERYEYTYNRKTHSWKNRPEDGVEDVVEPMIEGLHEARLGGTTVLRNYLIENFDVEKVLRYMATINYVGTFDDMFQNHYLYRKADDGKWMMLPWDMDNTLGGAYGEWNAHPLRGADESRVGNVGNRSGWWNRIKDSFFIAFEEEFLAMFDYLNHHVYSPELLNPVIEKAAEMRGLGQGSVDALMDHVQRRHGYLDGFIDTQDPIAILDIDRDIHGNLVLSWDWRLFGYHIESAGRVDDDWDTLPHQPDLYLNQYQVVLPQDHDIQFFRLRKQ